MFPVKPTVNMVGCSMSWQKSRTASYANCSWVVFAASTTYRPYSVVVKSIVDRQFVSRNGVSSSDRSHDGI